MKRSAWFRRVTVIFAEEGTDSSQRAPWWFLIPFIVAVAAVALLYYRQRVLLVPVPARPLSGAIVDSRRQVGFTWTRIPEKSANYHIQIAADRGFKKMMYETRVKDQHEIKPRGIFDPGRSYYWRLQAIVDGKTSPWTRKMWFRAE
jgi:hypothetical protein